MRRGLIADLRKTGRPLDNEAARELTNLRRILEAIEANAGRIAPGDSQVRMILGLAEQGLSLITPE